MLRGWCKMYYFYRLKDCREDKDMSQTDIAEILKIDQRIYSNYEIGKRQIPVNHLITLAIFYNTSLDYLVGLTNEFTPPKRNSEYEMNQFKPK